MAENILIITLDMVPYALQFGSCQRMYYLAEKLVESNYNVYLIHYAQKENIFNYKKINFVAIPIFKNTKNTELSVFVKKHNKFLFFLYKATRWFNYKLKLTIENFLYNEPVKMTSYYSKIFLALAKNQISNLILNFNIKIIVISGPPFRLFSIIKFIKRLKPDIKVIVDYRDPWNYTLNFRMSYFKEKRVIKLADKIVLFSEKYKENFKEIFQIDDKLEVVYNGYDENIWNSLKAVDNKKSKLIISYVGSYTFDKLGWCYISEILEAFVQFNSKNTILQFVGLDRYIEMDYWEKKSKYKIEFIPPVQQIKAIEYMNQSDVLIVLYSWSNKRADFMITGKFFDYIASDKVIWGIGKKYTDFNEMIVKYSLGIISENFVIDILKGFQILENKWQNGELKSLRNDQPQFKKHFSRDFQNQKYLKILSNLLKQ